MGELRRAVMVAIGLSIVSLASCRTQSNPVPAPVQPGGNVDRPALADSVPVARSVGPVASSRVAPGRIAGIVVDATTGRPLQGAQVSLLEPGGTVVTDSSGQFGLRVPNDRRTVHVARIGYDRYTATVPTADSGWVIVVALRRQPTRLCRVILPVALMVDSGGVRRLINPVYRYPGVIVTVWDALTARAPTVPIVVSARDDDYRDSTVVRADSAGHMVANLAADRPGTYTIVVRGAGFREWASTMATAAVPGCPGEFRAAVAQVWLLPR